MGPMRDFFRFQEPAGDDDELSSLIAEMKSRQAPTLPLQAAPRRMPPPERTRPTFADILPQLLAGAADTVNAGAGYRSDTLGRVMGMQKGYRDQAHADALQRQAFEYENDRANFEDRLRRYQLETSAEERSFNRKSKLAELVLMQQALGKQRQDQEGARFKGYKDLLGRASDRKSLKLEADKLRAMNPKDRAFIDQAEQSLGSVFDIEAAQPNKLEEQYLSSLPPEITKGAGGHFKAMTKPAGDKGFPVFNAPRGYRWLYGTGVGSLGAGAMDLGEAAGLWELDAPPVPGGRLLAPALSPYEQAESERRWLQKRMQQANPNPYWDWVRSYRGGY